MGIARAVSRRRRLQWVEPEPKRPQFILRAKPGAQFDDLVDRAIAGDVEAATDLSEAARRLLDDARRLHTDPCPLCGERCFHRYSNCPLDD